MLTACKIYWSSQSSLTSVSIHRTKFHAPRHLPDFRLGFEDGIMSQVQGGPRETSKVVITLDYTCSEGLFHRDHTHAHAHTHPAFKLLWPVFFTQSTFGPSHVCWPAQPKLQGAAQGIHRGHMAMTIIPSCKPCLSKSFLPLLPAYLSWLEHLKWPRAMPVL